MQKLIPYILSAFLSITFSFFAMEKAFPQTSQRQANDTASNEGAPYVRGLTPARAKSLIGGVLGLASVIIGWRVKARMAAAASGSQLWCFASLALGVVAIALSVLHLASNTGAFGTGGGKAGAIVALVLGLIGTGISGMALRSKRTSQS